ncbi:LAQU0S02e03378g1_1 [Lachancea quebecensis]|uniref:N-acetyltransferase ECO1 n=1 Tax=Lachancea quebecensis TaxID=1654605 RepID=A0A0P1KN62_9SACH|nr:LAQU0S02e03378g1_1 [Lachancea quebecensis]
MARPPKNLQNNSTGKKLTQSVLRLDGNDSAPRRCHECGMTFSPHISSDVNLHEKYHVLHLNGRKWSMKWGDIIEKYQLNRETSEALHVNLQLIQNRGPWSLASSHTALSHDYVAQISASRKSEVMATLDIMEIVNDELKAPQNENHFWSHLYERDGISDFKGQTKPTGTAFVYVSNKRAVGVITLEYLNSRDERGRWMIYDTAGIVSNVKPSFKLGISRVWVCKQQRGRGIGTRLLEAARKYAVPGFELEKLDMAWSQPSESGGKLAKSYNGVVHQKSGKVLIPCYI